MEFIYTGYWFFQVPVHTSRYSVMLSVYLFVSLIYVGGASDACISRKLAANLVTYKPWTNTSKTGVYIMEHGLPAQVTLCIFCITGPPQLLNLTAISANLNISKLESYDMEEFPDSLSVWKAEINIDMDIPSEIEAAVQSNPPASNTWTAVRHAVFSLQKKLFISHWLHFKQDQTLAFQW